MRPSYPWHRPKRSGLEAFGPGLAAMRDRDTLRTVQPLRHALALVALGACLVALPASADEKNADVLACEGKSEGDPCQRTVVVKPDDGEAQQRREPGVCRMGECCKLDYSKGSPPESVCTPCLTCQPGPSDAEPGGNGTAQAPSEAPRAGNGDDPPASAPKGRGCNVDAPSTRAAWALVLLAVVLRRRRTA
jgi:MYXO-CTERM domain-containing protein